MRNFIEAEYTKLEDVTLKSLSKYNILNNIIQIKLLEPDLKNTNQDLSIDIKQYLKYIIENAESERIGYDSIEIKKVNELLSQLHHSDKLFYLNFFIRQLQKNSFEDEINKFQNLKIKIILKQILTLKEFYKPSNLWLLCLYFPLYNIPCLILTFSLFGLAIAIALLPAPTRFMGVLSFDLEYQSISSNNTINHFLNMFCYFSGIETSFKLIPRNTLSTVIFILTKILAVIYIVNYLFNRLIEYLKK